MSALSGCPVFSLALIPPFPGQIVLPSVHPQTIHIHIVSPPHHHHPLYTAPLVGVYPRITYRQSTSLSSPLHPRHREASCIQARNKPRVQTTPT